MASTGTTTFRNFIGGEWVDSASGETFESTSPATGDSIGVFPKSNAEDVDRAVEAADLFNGSTYRRTVGGIAKSLGEAKASIVPLSGVAGEIAVTVAWDLSWYQYRVSPESAQPVRLERRGHELDELEETFKTWNAHVEDEGRLVPEIARI